MIGVLLANLGTPDAPTTSAVRRYLREFLSDPRVIDIPPAARWALVHLIIAPFRSPKSAEAYRKIWTPEGSPHLVHMKNLTEAVARQMAGSCEVAFGMRYGNPSITAAIEALIGKGVSELRVLPLFPQYASSSTGSAIEEVFRVLGKRWNIPAIKILPAFHDHPGLIQSFAEIGKPFLDRIKPDHVLFSFHGLPERHIQKGDPYQQQCMETAMRIASRLNLFSGSWSASFQSRLGRTPWIKPYTDLELIRLAQSGKKRLAVFCPAFVTDCLETLEEIGIRGRASFLQHGGETLELIPSLNAHPSWVDAVCQMVSSA